MAMSEAQVRQPREKTSIPGAIWRQVNRDMEAYTWRKKQLQDAKTGVYDLYAGVQWPTNDRVSGGKQNETAMDAAIYRLTSTEILAQEAWIQMFEDVLQDLKAEERHFFRLYYEEGRGLIACGGIMARSERGMGRLKRQVVETFAERMGYRW